MFPDQPMGLAIQFSRGQKKGATSTVHPISGSLARGSGVSRLIIASNASRDSAPFFLSNTSQASDRGSVENLTNVPPPPMWLYGRLSLNKKGAPASSPTKGAVALGCQKLTSSTSARLRKANQSGSVTPTHSFIVTPPKKASTCASPVGVLPLPPAPAEPKPDTTSREALTSCTPTSP